MGVNRGDKNTEFLTVRLSQWQRDHFRAIANTLGKSLSEALRDLIMLEIAKHAELMTTRAGTEPGQAEGSR